MDVPAAMARALELAERGRGFVEPNPVVGAVLLDEAAGAVLGEGYHQRFGGPHAEVEALADARRNGHDLAGKTIVVTLEPCNHHGKTPPCVDALLAARVGKVVAAMVDPFEKVAGQGIARLRAAGVTVEVGLLEAQARRSHEPFIKRVTTGLPWTIAKWAQTLDGKIATSTGDSKWISCEASRRQVHALRGRVDAIVVGVGTVAADDPALTARDTEIRRVARRVVIDPHLRLPPDAALLQKGSGVIFPPVLVAAEAEAVERGGEAARRLRAAGVELFPLAERCGHRLDLRPLFRHLASAHAASNVLVEGGAGVAGAVFEQGLADQVLVYLAPKLLGDPDALDPVRGVACERIDEAHRLDLVHHERVGGDILLDYRVRTPA